MTTNPFMNVPPPSDSGAGVDQPPLVSHEPQLTPDLTQRLEEIRSKRFGLERCLTRVRSEDETSLPSIRSETLPFFPADGLSKEELDSALQAMLISVMNEEKEIERSLGSSLVKHADIEMTDEESAHSVRRSKTLERRHHDTLENLPQISSEALVARHRWATEELQRFASYFTNCPELRSLPVQNLPAGIVSEQPISLAEVAEELSLFPAYVTVEMVSLELQRRIQKQTAELQAIEGELQGREFNRQCQAVCQAIDTGNCAEIRLLHEESGFDLNQPMTQTRRGRTPLTYALEQGKVDVAIFLLRDMGADPQVRDEAPDRGGFNFPSTVAILNPSIHVTEATCALLDLLFRETAEGKPINMPIGFETALVIAIKKGRDDFARLFIERYQANVNQAIRFGRSPLTAAVEKNNKELIRYLFEHGALLDQSDGEKYSPLTYAIKLKNLEMCQFLEGLGANPHQADSGGRSPTEFARQTGLLQ